MLDFLEIEWDFIFPMLVSNFLFFMGLGGTIYYWRRERRCTESTSGEVFKLEEKVDNEGSTLYKSWVCFQVAGQTYRVPDQIASLPASHRVGERVTVYYPPGQPELACIGRWRSVLPFALIGTFGGLLLIVFLVRKLYFQD